MPTQTPVLDQTHDLSGTEYHRLTQAYGTPEFVKQASHEQKFGDDAGLATHLYADTATRSYPCHAKAATWLSALFFGDTEGMLPQEKAAAVRQRILDSASYWKIRPEVEELWEKQAENAKQSMHRVPDEDFALVWEGPHGKERHYPLRNSAEVEKAAQWFGVNHNEFTFGDKNVIATKILEKAAQYSSTPDNPDLLHRCAGYGYCGNAAAVEEWEKRAGLLRRKKPEHAKIAQETADGLRKNPLEMRDQATFLKMAALMDEFDRDTALHRLYGDGLARPEDSLFRITEKTASDFLNAHVQLTTGAVFEKQALEALDIPTLQSWMGEEMADECGGVMMDHEKLAEIVSTLPRPEAEMFERMAREVGIPVVAREKTSGVKFDSEELQALAEMYEPADG